MDGPLMIWVDFKNNQKLMILKGEGPDVRVLLQ